MVNEDTGKEIVELPEGVSAALEELRDLELDPSVVVIVVAAENEMILRRARLRLRVAREVVSMDPIEF